MDFDSKGIQNHICLIPCGGLGEISKYEWTEEDLSYYTFYHINGVPIDHMFKSFIFNGISVNQGRYIEPMYAGFGTPANIMDWIKWIHILFEKNMNLKALFNTAQDSHIDVWVSIPYPYFHQNKFGKINGIKINFENDQHRLIAVTWWIDKFLQRLEAESHLLDRLNFRGFTWQRRSIHDYDEDLVIQTNQYIKEKGYLSMWLPFYGSYGFLNINELGFNITAIHPNYYGNTPVSCDFIDHAINSGKKYQSGLLIVYGKGKLYSENHLLDYLNLGLSHNLGPQNNRLFVYEFPNQTMKEIYDVRLDNYIKIYSYIKGIYQVNQYPNMPYKIEFN